MDGDLKKGLVIAVVGSIIALAATVFQTIIPIYFSSESSDFSIFIQPMNINVIPFTFYEEPSFLQILDPSKFDNTTKLANTSAIIEVRNIHNTISPYIHTVFLKTNPNDKNIFIDFDNPEGVPPFETKMLVYIKPTNKSLIENPITVQGIGGNGIIRNCTFYITYITPDDYVNRGRNLSAAARYIDALESYNNALLEKPKFARAWFYKGVLYSNELNDYANGLDAFNKSIEIDKTLYESFYNIALIHQRWGNYSEALKNFNRTIELNPRWSWPRIGKGLSLISLKKNKEALESLDDANRLDPGDTSAWYYKGIALQNLGQFNESIEIYEKILALRPDMDKNRSIDVFRRESDAYCSINDYNNATKILDKILVINQLDVDAWFNKGLILTYLGKYDEALCAYNKALEINPKIPEIWDNKGFIFCMQGNYKEAILSYDNAIKLAPHNARAWNSRGLAFSSLSEYNKAVESYDESIRL